MTTIPMLEKELKGSDKRVILDKWKKKPLKKELYDIIKLQEERISELNKERMKLNVVIRNEKPIRIDTHGLDYMVDLEQKYYDLQSIIKEVREYATQHMMELAKRKGINGEENGAIYVAVADLLEIVDKVGVEK